MRNTNIKIALSFVIASVFIACQPGKNKNNGEKSPGKRIDTTIDLSLTNDDQARLKYVNSINADTVLKAPDQTEEGLKATLEFYKAQENYIWKMIELAEKTKFDDFDRLIKEVSYNPKHNESDLEKLSKITDKMKACFTMREALEVNNDSIHDVLMQKFFEIGEATPDMKNYTFFAELKTEILQINNEKILSLRNNHADAVTLLNNFIDKNKVELEKLGLDTKKMSNWYPTAPSL